MKFISNKRGTVFDLLTVAVVVLCLAIAIPYLFFAFDTSATPIIQEFNQSNDTQSETMLSNSVQGYPSIWDSAIIMIFIGLWITSLIGAFFLDSHPIFFIIAILLLTPMLFAMIIIQNTFILTASSVTYLTVVNDFPMTYALMSNWLIVSIVLVSTIAGALYLRSQQ